MHEITTATTARAGFVVSTENLESDLNDCFLIKLGPRQEPVMEEETRLRALIERLTGRIGKHRDNIVAIRTRLKTIRAERDELRARVAELERALEIAGEREKALLLAFREIGA